MYWDEQDYQRLHAQYLAGDPAALDSLAARHYYPLVTAIAEMRRFPSADDKLDYIQIVVARCITRTGNYCPANGSAHSYFTQIAITRYCTFIRGLARHNSAVRCAGAPAESPILAAQPDPSPSPRDRAAAAEQSRAIRRAMNFPS